MVITDQYLLLLFRVRVGLWGNGIVVLFAETTLSAGVRRRIPAASGLGS